MLVLPALPGCWIEAQLLGVLVSHLGSPKVERLHAERACGDLVCRCQDGTKADALCRAEPRLSHPAMPTHSLYNLEVHSSCISISCLIQGCAHVQRPARPPPACKRSTATTTTRCSRMLGTSWWSLTSTHSGGFLLWEDSVLRGLGLGGTRGQAVNHLRLRSRAEEYSFMYEGAGLG